MDPHNRRALVIAPRGHAKTTWLHKIGGAWCVCYPEIAKKKFPFLFSDTKGVAVGNLGSIKRALESNVLLRQDFGNLVGKEKWATDEILTANGIRIETAGTDKAVRGRTSDEDRPDFLLIDDLENETNVITPFQRDKVEGWLDKTVLKLPGPRGYDAIYSATLLHRDSVAARKMVNAGWDSYFYKAVYSWPVREDLWDQWRTMFTDLSVPQKARQDAAYGFYDENKDEMDRGSEVLWPDGKGIHDLQQERVLGESAFEQEFQNNPRDPAACKFQEDWFKYWWLDAEIGEPGGFKQPEIEYFVGSCDPSMGEDAKAGDYSAIIILGKATDGRSYVFEADLQRRSPDQIILDIIEMQRRYRCREWAFESNVFQKFVMKTLIKRSLDAGVPVPAIPVNSRSNKALRIIGMLQPAIQNAFIIFRAQHNLLMSQLKDYTGNNKDHDDGPDALEMAYSRFQGQVIASTAPDVGYRTQPATRSGVSIDAPRSGVERSTSSSKINGQRNPFRNR